MLARRLFASSSNAGLAAFFEAGCFLSAANVGAGDAKPTAFGRAWSSPELRRKSFDDLHRLWWVLQREKNCLFTQQAEATRLGVRWLEEPRLRACYQSMARIKGTLTERRLAYQAARIELQQQQQPHIEKMRAAYLAEQLPIKRRRQGFRRLVRHILGKHPHFD